MTEETLTIASAAAVTLQAEPALAGAQSQTFACPCRQNHIHPSHLKSKTKELACSCCPPSATSSTRRRRSHLSGHMHWLVWVVLGVLLVGCGLATKNGPSPSRCHHLSPLEESLLDEVDCFSGSQKCDLVKLHFRRGRSREDGLRVRFQAFGQHFKLKLSRDTHAVNHTRRSSSSSPSFFSGSLQALPSAVAVRLNSQGISGHFAYSEVESFFILPRSRAHCHQQSQHQTRNKWTRMHKVYRSNTLPLFQDFATSLVARAGDDDVRFRRSSASLSPLGSALNVFSVDVSGQSAVSANESAAPAPVSLALPVSWPPGSKDNWVQVMVVADGPMVRYHGSNLRQYILTLMNIVSLIYRDKSLGNSVQMAVVRLLILDETESFAPSTADAMISASEMLKAFCKWQSHISDYAKDERDDYDVALLLTRENICRNPDSPNQNCDTLGLAELGTMCDRYSCAIVQDNGLSAAFTIAHELGHVLNMPHDDDQKCLDFTLANSSVSYVMSRMLDHNTNPWEWSPCSKHYVTTFLDANYGHCLQNKPRRNLLETKQAISKYPGEYFDENKQCQFVFGSESKICPYMPPCSRLWCTNDGGEEHGCRTQHMPWADGTACGPGMWCLKGECMNRTASASVRAKPVDGAWGQWQPWSQCSRTCGGGIRQSWRHCDSPEPSEGGLFCVGDRVRYESCNTWDCPRGSKDFRLEQCEVYNGNNFQIEGVPDDVKWVPKYTNIRGTDKCKLFCRVQHSSAYYLLASSVIDGTPCGADTFHTCVNGQCIPAGCDHVLGSGKQLDWCGICGGDNSTCQQENGVYNMTQYGYHAVVRIPARATNIEIRQYGYRGQANDDTYIALRDVDTGEYILNGDFVMSMFRKTLEYAGMTLEYSGSDTIVERVNSSQPLRKDLLVEVLTVGNLFPPQVHYSYVISRPSKKIYKWKPRTLPKWSHCDKQCQGKQYSSTVVCVESQPGYEPEVDESLCSYLPAPKRLVKDCNMHCSLTWKVISRSSCSAKCGLGTQRLTYGCMRVMANLPDMQLPDKYCISENTEEQKPPETVECEGACEGVKWQYGAWGMCSQTCGGGYQTRLAQCVDSDGNPLDETKCLAISPVLKRACGSVECPSWKTGDWTTCNVTCGIGVRQRPYWCELDGTKIDGRYCSGETIPRHIDTCTEKPCTSWKFGNWSPCSVTCSTGEKGREVFCQEEESGERVEDHYCSSREKPLASTRCFRGACDRLIDEASKLHPIRTTKVFSGRFSGLQSSSKFKPHFFKSPLQYRWKVGPWHPCSRECGRGIQERAVVCFDSFRNVRVVNDFCQLNVKRPNAKRYCERVCAEGKWIYGEWSECSVTCGIGFQDRYVSCVRSDNGELLRNEYCKGDPLPSERSCPNNPPCSHQVPQSSHVSHSRTHPVNDTQDNRQTSAVVLEWRLGEWSTCSQTCGGGVKRRVVACQNENGTQSTSCNQALKPSEEIVCNTEPCPRWNYGLWGECNQPCGGGHQSRLVRCQDHLGQTTLDLRCEFASRPTNTRACNAQPCKSLERRPKYLWKRSRWSMCSKSCDKGVSIRSVQCVDLSHGGRAVSDSLCLGLLERHQRRTRHARRLRKPKTSKTCNKLPCPFKWVPGQWTECTHSCGKGVQTRSVNCHRVNSYGWIDPEAFSHGCNSTEKPAEVQTCAVADCKASYMWAVESWGDCSWEGRGCGKRGRQKRKMNCLNARGEKVRKRLCKRHLVRKPKRTRKCEKMICGHENCLDMRSKTGFIKDAEYELLLAGKNVTIYCHGMNSTMPREYLTLPRGEEDNYSEIYGLRLLEPHSCPFNGTRNDDCDCVIDSSRRQGLTVFNKIRVNVTSLKVNTHDFTFARQVRGEIVPYGEAGDCYSTANCPQGRFGIDLTGTGLRVSPYTGWVGQGNRPSLWLKRESENQVIHGKCGGYCGTCVPEPHHGLKLDLLPPS